jgi:hypothetical protein
VKKKPSIFNLQPIINLPLVRAVLGLSDDGLCCDEFQALLPAYVDAESRDIPNDPLYHSVKRRLLLYPSCEEDYLELVGLVLAEEKRCLPWTPCYPAFDPSFLPKEKDSDE